MQQLIRIFFLALLTGHAFSQAAEGQFIDDVRTTPGCNALVRSSATLANGDVILGGNFTRCGDVRANRVVRFDGKQFFSLGIGAENGVSGRVSAVFVDGEKIYVGGHFSHAGSVRANNIAVFENGQWQSIGSGLNNGVTGFVRAIQSFRGKLYVGGYEYATFLWAATLKQWDGDTWSNLVEFESQGNDSVINAFEVDQDRLYFAGSFRPRAALDQNLGSFDGQNVRFENFPSTNPVGPNRVRDLHFFQGRLCAAGGFALQSPSTVSGVACLQGTQWQGFGRFPNLRTLANSGSTLYGAGLPYEVSDTNYGAALIAFEPSQIRYFSRTQRADSDYVYTLVNQGDSLILGGSFAQQQLPMQNLMRLRLGALEPLSSGDPPRLNGPLQEMVAANNVIYGIDYLYGVFAPPLRAYRINQFANGLWSEMPQPASSNQVSGSLLSLRDTFHFSGSVDGSGFGELFAWSNNNWTQIGTRVSVGGVFQNTFVSISGANPEGIRNIWKFNGAVMEPFLQVPPLKRRGFQDDNLPITLAEFRGMPVIAGSFDEMVGVGPVGSVAIYFDNAWHPLGSPGLADPGASALGAVAAFDMLEWQGQLYVSNGLSQADGVTANGVARFDGKHWHPLGSGLQQTDSTLFRPYARFIVYQDQLYVYGNFDRAGGQPAHNIAQWDGESWHALGSGAEQGLGTDTQSSVQSAAIVNGNLVLSGEIHEAGGAPADFFAIWRGDAWLANGFE